MSDEIKRMVGVELPDHLNQYLVLSAERLDTSKSEVIRQALSQWKEEDGKPSVNTLVDDIAEQLQAGWDKRKFKLSTNNTDKAFTEYQSRNKERLLSKGLHKETVNSIINQLSK